MSGVVRKISSSLYATISVLKYKGINGGLPRK
jgi:hypothetical protein